MGWVYWEIRTFGNIALALRVAIPVYVCVARVCVCVSAAVVLPRDHRIEAPLPRRVALMMCRDRSQ